CPTYGPEGCRAVWRHRPFRPDCPARGRRRRSSSNAGTFHGALPPGGANAKEDRRAGYRRSGTDAGYALYVATPADTGGDTRQATKCPFLCNVSAQGRTTQRRVFGVPPYG